MEEIRVGGVYKHYKRGEYKVIGLGRDCEDASRQLVLYEQLYGGEEFPKGQIWVRELSVFLEDVEVGGKRIKRFSLVE